MVDDSKLTVGQALRRYRQRIGMSQFDLAICMDWKGTNPIVQIEKDRRIPQPDTLQKLAECLDLTHQDLHFLNGLAGFIPPTRFPPQAVVLDTLNRLEKALAAHPYPKYVVDYQFRVWMANPATVLYTNGDADRLRELLQRPLTALDMVFDSRVGMLDGLANLDFVQHDQVFRFKATNAFRQHEDFYQSLPARMRGLPAADYRRFMQVWQSIQIEQGPDHLPASISAYYEQTDTGYLHFQYPQGVVKFDLQADSVLHLGDLFVIATLNPVADSVALAKKICLPIISEQTDFFKLWELTNIAPFFAG